MAFGLVGLLLLVALAARGGHPGSDGHVTTRSIPASLQNSLVTLLAIVYVLLIVGVIVLFFRGASRGKSRWNHTGSRTSPR